MRSKLLLLGSLAVVILPLAGCKKREAAEPVEAPAGAPAAGVGVTGTASIVGTVSFHGKVPAMPSPARTAFAECVKKGAKGPADPTMLLSAEGGVQNAFVWIKAGVPPGDYPIPTEPVRLDQQSCEYEPRVFGIRLGQPLQLVNSDSLLHNVHAPGFNVPLPNKGATLTKKLLKPEVVATITCDVHPWMRAYAGVVKHPFFAVTDSEGRYAIKDLPAGTYTIEVWQERLSRAEQGVQVANGEAKTVAFEMKPR